MKKIQELLKVPVIDEEMKTFYKKVLILVIPLALQNIINVGITATDVILLGRVSETVLSGASLAGQIQFIMSLIFFGLTSGATVLSSQYWGKKDKDVIEKILGLTLRISLVIALIFTLISYLFSYQIMGFFTNEQAVIIEGVKFLKIISWSYLFIGFTMIYLQVMRSIERVIVATVVYLTSLFVNVIMNSLLIFGLFGFPKLGIEGAAIGTLVARAIELLIVVGYARWKNKDIKVRLKNILHVEKWLQKDFLKYSIPVMLNELFWGAGYSANAAIIGHLGSSVVASNSIAHVVRQLALVVTFGLANATAIMVGKVIGEGNNKLAEKYANRFVILSIFCGLVGGALVFFGRPLIVAGMNLKGESADYLYFMLFVMSYFIICQAFNTTVIVGVFRAGGDTKFGLFVDIGTLWCGSIVLGFFAAFVFHLPIKTVYLLLMCDELLKIPFSYYRYRKRGWLNNVTR